MLGVEQGGLLIVAPHRLRHCGSRLLDRRWQPDRGRGMGRGGLAGCRRARGWEARSGLRPPRLGRKCLQRLSHEGRDADAKGEEHGSTRVHHGACRSGNQDEQREPHAPPAPTRPSWRGRCVPRPHRGRGWRWRCGRLGRRREPFFEDQRVIPLNGYRVRRLKPGRPATVGRLPLPSTRWVRLRP